MDESSFIDIPIEEDLRRFLKRAALILSIAVVAVACFVLIGWQWDIMFFKRPIPHLAAMNPLSACCFLMTGLAAALSNRTSKLQHTYRPVVFARPLLIIVLIIGIIKITDSLFILHFHIDHLLYTDALIEDSITHIPGSMAVTTAFNFVLCALALLFLNSENARKQLIAQFFALFIGFSAVLSLLGYAYKVHEFYGILAYLPMAFHTALCFVMLALMLLFTKPTVGMMVHITGSFSSSITARILLTASILIPFTFGYFALASFHDAGLHTELIVAVLVLSIMVVFFALVSFNTVQLNRKELQKNKVEKAMAALTKQLAASNEELIDTNKSLEQFSYVASHDLQEPLRKIKLFGNLLHTKYAPSLDEEGINLIVKMQAASDRMSSLIVNLLTYSRISQDQPELSVIDPNSILEEVIADLEPVITAKGAVLIIDRLTPINGDDTQLKQLFQNLLSNALKFTVPNVVPHIHITSKQVTGNDMRATAPSLKNNTASFQQIDISDNGIGFDKEHGTKIFEPFQRLHSTNEFPGTGIGLSIVQKTIANHKGYVFTDSTPGKGSTFTLLFPSVS